jgi:membrane-associated phospholipid phosphatase
MLLRVIASALVACTVSASAFAQTPEAVTATARESVVAAPDGSTEQLPVGAPVAPPVVTPPLAKVSPVAESNIFKLTAGDFKNFFRYDTLKTMSYFGVAAVAAAPWDREGVNNGFNLPTTVFQGGNLIGSFAFQASASMATYGIGRATHNQKAAAVGRDLMRAQLLSQGMVQATKVTVRRERPDGSDNMSFPSGHAASMFASASILQTYYGWKVGAPAYALGSYVALARMAYNRHHATDVVMGAAFGFVSAKTVTMSFASSKFNLGVQPQAGGASVNFTKVYK